MIKIQQWLLQTNSPKRSDSRQQLQQSHQKIQPKSIGMKYERYMEYHKRFLVTDDLNLPQYSWKTQERYQKQSKLYLWHTILRLMDKQKELTKKLKCFYNIMLIINKTIEKNGYQWQNSSIMTRNIQVLDISYSN